jgi:hypothetical protein
MVLIIVPMSSGSIRNVCSLSSVTRAGAAPIIVSTVRPTAVPDGTIMVMYGTYESFGSAPAAAKYFRTPIPERSNPGAP